MTNFAQSFFLIVFLSAATVYSAQEYVPLQERAQGQSLTAASLHNDSLFSNPASSSFTNVYSLDATYMMPKTFSVSVLDTKTSLIGGALGYFRKVLPNLAADGSEQTMQGIKLGVSGKLSEKFGVGLSGKILWGQFGAVQSRYNDLDAGLLVNLSPVQLGLTVRNLINTGDPLFDLHRELAAGFRIHYQETLFFALTASTLLDRINLNQISAGAEYVSPYFFSLKGGFRYLPEAAQSFWSGGASLNTPKLSFHYAVEFPNQQASNIEHFLGMSFLF